MPASHADVLATLERLRAQHSAQLNATSPRLLTFLGTTSRPHTHLALAPRSVARLAPHGERGVDVVLRGALPREPVAGERVATSLLSLTRFRGYQIKSQERATTGVPAEAPVSRPDPGHTVVHGRFVFTVHESPNTKTFFERVPLAELTRDVGDVSFAPVGVGPDANISPRFVWHFDADARGVRLYYGNGHLNKTAANFARNHGLSVLAVDLASFQGYVFYGQGRHLSEASEPERYERVRREFVASGWGEPSAVTEIACDRWEAVRAE